MGTIIYFCLGIIWSSWLEHYTTSKLEGVEGTPWGMSERFVQIVFWPILFYFFIRTLIITYRDRNNDKDKFSN